VPRHTHPTTRAKHDRGHVRAARERYIARRFHAHKNGNSSAYARFDLHPDLVDPDLAGDVAELLAAAKQRIPADPYGAYGWPQPELARVIDPVLSRRLGNGLILGRLAKAVLPGYCDGCPCCKPYRHHPGYRGRVKRHDRRLIADGLDAWTQEDPAEINAGRLVSANRELRDRLRYC
jgi:hypothetical protein